MKRMIWMLAVLGVVGGAFAQAPSMDSAPELKKLDWYIGKWSGKVKWTMPGMPEAEEAMSFTNTWDGQFLKSTSVMDMMGMKMTESSYLGWNPKEKRYESYTFTNFAPTPRIEHGEMKGENTMVFTSLPWDVGGMEMSSRATLVKKSDTEVSFVLEFKMGDKFEKAGEGTFKKQK
jgi:hypothetical protein